MLVDEEAIGPSRLLKRTVICFGKAKPFYLLTSIQGSTIAYGIQSPSDNWLPVLVCVVVLV